MQNRNHLYREGVHVGSDRHERRASGADIGPDSRLRQREPVTDLHLIQLLADKPARFVLLESELWILVDSPPDSRKPPEILRPPREAQDLRRRAGLSPDCIV